VGSKHGKRQPHCQSIELIALGAGAEKIALLELRMRGPFEDLALPATAGAPSKRRVIGTGARDFVGMHARQELKMNARLPWVSKRSQRSTPSLSGARELDCLALVLGTAGSRRRPGAERLARFGMAINLQSLFSERRPCLG
jgi:hypothetical protein